MFLMNQIKNDPSHTVFGFGKQVRRAWVVKIMSSDKHALLGVQVGQAALSRLSLAAELSTRPLSQTMRNELLVGQFLAQASFVALSLGELPNQNHAPPKKQSPAPDTLTLTVQPRPSDPGPEIQEPNHPPRDWKPHGTGDRR